MAVIFPFSIRDLFRLTRFWNLAIVALTQFATAFWLMPGFRWDDLRLWLLIFSTTAVAAAGYIINDYYDIKIDLINKPDRVVVGKSITRRYALLIHSALNFFAIGVGFLISWKIGLVHFLSAFLLWLYSNQLKRQPLIGNVTVALLTGFCVEIVNFFYGENNSVVTIYAVFAFFMTLIREIIKDMEDWRGDSTFGCQTLPILWGLRKTKTFIFAVLAVFVITVIILNQLFTELPNIYFLLFLFVPLSFLSYRLQRADTTLDFHRLSTLCKVIMMLGILSMGLVR
jgi:4-hydroxybenzoate polyprenyltransferase